jgi:VWFA-related protein
MTVTHFVATATALLLMGSGPAALSANPPLPPQEATSGLPAPEFPAGVDMVTVDAVVLDSAGNPIEGLTADDFMVTDKGKLRRLVSFEAVILPEPLPGPPPLRARVSTNTRTTKRPARTFVIVFDNLHMSQGRAEQAKDAVNEFVLNGLAEGDRVTAVPTSGGAWWTGRIPDDRPDLVAALDRLQGERPRNTSIDRISDYEAMRLHLHRDQQIGFQVIKRYYEHRIILEPPGMAALDEELDLGEGHPLIRIKATEVYQNQRVRKVATLNTLTRVAESLASVKGRKSIMLVSEGFVQEPNMPEFRDVARAAREANAVIYFVDARGLGGLPLTADAEIAEAVDVRDLGPQIGLFSREALGAISVAVDSGGFSIRNSNDFAQGMREIDRQSRSYYLFGFSIGDVERNGKFHGIKVKVHRPGVKVVARKGYYAPSDEPEKPLGEDELDPQIRAALDSPFETDSIPLRLTSYVLGPGEEGTTVLLVADIDPRGLAFEQKGGRHEDVLGTYLLVSARDTGERFHKEREVELSLPPQLREQINRTWLPQIRDFQLAPGTYQARLLVRDRQSQKVGTVYHEFEVPEPGELRVSTPILTDVLQPSAGGEAAPPRPVPLARDTFAPGRTVYYAFQIHGAQAGPGQAPRVLTGYRIETIDGTVVATRPPTALSPGTNGELSQMFALDLTRVAPGDYVFVLNVRDYVAGKRLELYDPFRVAGVPGSRY